MHATLKRMASGKVRGRKKSEDVIPAQEAPIHLQRPPIAVSGVELGGEQLQPDPNGGGGDFRAALKSLPTEAILAAFAQIRSIADAQMATLQTGQATSTAGSTEEAARAGACSARSGMRRAVRSRLTSRRWLAC